MSWTNERNGSNDVHCYPVDDIIPHEWINCACLPVTEALKRDDGSYGWLIVHNAWDGRE